MAQKKRRLTSDGEVWKGEIAGDISAFFIYMFIKRALSRPVDGLIDWYRGRFDKRLEKNADKALSRWALYNHVDKADPRYQEKLQKIKHSEAENEVDSLIIATAATAANPFFQKMFGNEKELPLILASKIVGSIATVGVMFGLRRAAPNTMNTMDEELSGRYFSKASSKVRGWLGMKDAQEEELPNEEKHYDRSFSTQSQSGSAIVYAGLAGLLAPFFYKHVKNGMEKVLPAEEASARKAIDEAAVEAYDAAIEANPELKDQLPLPVSKVTTKDEALIVGNEFFSRIGMVAASALALLGLSSLLPDTFRSLSEEVRDRYLSKFTGKKKVEVAAATAASIPAVTAYTPAEGSALQSASQLSGAPLVPHTLSMDKEQSLARMVAQHAAGVNLSDPEAKAQFIAQEKRLLRTMGDVLNPDGELVKLMGEKHLDVLHHVASPESHPNLYGQTENLPLFSLEAMQSIALNRRDDLAMLTQRLDQDEFMQKVEAAVPTLSQASAPGLSQQKREMLINSLLQTDNHPGRAEPTVHIYANAKGQVIEHKILAHVFKPDGDVSQFMTQSMQQALPNMKPDYLQQVVQNYMQDRQNAAYATVDHFKLDGDLVREAVARSESIRQRYAPEQPAQLAVA